MRWSERIKKSLRALPQGQWRCIWCDRTTPEVTFEAREHVMPESLGGASDFKLPRGAVCDQCNKHGVLKQIDEDLNIYPLIRFLRFACGLGRRFRELQPGIRRTGPDSIAVNPSELAENASAEMSFDATEGWTLSVRSSGPSTKTRNEHLARGLHRMAFNAIADALGPSRAVADFAHLRAYVLAGETVPMRACLFDEKTLNENLRAAQPWKASYELLRDQHGAHAIAFLRLGMAFFYVSLKPGIEPLQELRSRHSWLRVVGELPDAE
jgi:hypothetical protein